MKEFFEIWISFILNILFDNALFLKKYRYQARNKNGDSSIQSMGTFPNKLLGSYS